MADTLERVKQAIFRVFAVEPEKITRDTRFREDLKADSLDLAEMMMEFEEEFKEVFDKSPISDDDMREIETVGQAVDYIEQHLVTDA